MKIVQIIARVNQGGTANWLNILVTELRSRGEDVQLYAGLVSNGEKEDETFSEVGGIRILSLGRKISLVNDLRAILEIRRVLKTQCPEIVNTHTAKAGMIGRLASVGLSCKVIHTYHGHLLYGYFSPAKTKLIIEIEKFLGRFTNAYIFVGEKVRQDLLAKGIGVGKPYRVILPAIDFAKFQNHEDEVDLSDPNSEHTFRVGWLGRLTAIKRVDRVLDLAKTLPSVEFLIGGDGEALGQELGPIPPNVRFLGWIKPEDFWNQCDVGILTSDNEGLPTSLIEAAISGVPVVSFNVGSTSEIIVEGETGFLVNNLTEMRSRIIQFEEDRTLINSFGSNARTRGIQRFGKENFLNGHLQIYLSNI